MKIREIAYVCAVYVYRLAVDEQNSYSTLNSHSTNYRVNQVKRISYSVVKLTGKIIINIIVKVVGVLVILIFKS